MKKFVYSGIAPNYPDHGDLIYRVRIQDKRVDKPIDLPGEGSRKRGMVGLASRDGFVYIAINNHDDAFSNAADVQDVDLDHCFPSYRKN